MISVIIPFYNGAITLNRAVESIKSQIFKDWELILVDDGSTDDSATLAQEYLNDSRIRYLFQFNQGVSAARNYGVRNSIGGWLLFLDSDDYLEKDSLKIVNDKIQNAQECAYILFGMRRIKKDSILIQKPEDGKYFSKLAGTFVVRKSVFEEVGSYDIRLKFSENTELFHRIGLLGYLGKTNQSVILNYLDNPNGGSKNLQNMIDSLLIILEKHQNTLSSHVKYLYYQIIGVNYMRFQNFSKARKYLLKAFSFKPYKVSTLIRFSISLIPPLAKSLYPEKIKV